MDDPFPEGMVEDIEEFLKDDAEPRGKNLYPSVYNTGLMFPLQRMREAEKMISIARTINPKVVMEIGTDKSGGLYQWVKCLPSINTMIASEIRGTPYQYAFEDAFPRVNFIWMRESRPVPKVVQDKKIDVLFIDGDKGGMFSDYVAYRKLMNSPSLIFVHDVCDPVPYRQFEQMTAKHKSEIIIDKSEAEEQIELDEQGIPHKNAYEAWLRHWRGSSCGVGVLYVL